MFENLKCSAVEGVQWREVASSVIPFINAPKVLSLGQR